MDAKNIKKKAIEEKDIDTVSKYTNHIKLLTKDRGENYIFTLGKSSGYYHKRSN